MRKAFMGGAAVAAFVVTSYAVWSFSRPGPVVAMRTPLRHDDFLFSVNDARAASATRVVVDILVVNQARRVGYAWNDSIAYLQDERGNRYNAVSRHAFELSPGTSRTAQVTFDVPADARGLAVRFWDGIDMGDALDGARYARSLVALPLAR